MGRVLTSRSVIVFALVVLSALIGASLQSSPAAAASSATPTPTPTATIVGLLSSQCTATTNVYKLSNGENEAQIYTQPIRFKDAQGAWQNFNTSLVSAGVPGVYHAAATPVTVTIGQTASGSLPASLAADGYTVTLALADASPALALTPGVSVASYLGVASATTLSYKVLNWGVEQSLRLASAAAPASFTCTLTHPGLSLAQDPSGAWGLYAPGKPRPVFLLSPISVSDASSDATGMPAICGAATMTVKPGAGSSTLTYTVPQSWLADSARVYPVTIDPQLILNPNQGDTTNCDTWVESNNPDNSHGPSGSLASGYTTAYHNTRSLVSFDLSSLTGAYVHSANFEVYKYMGHGSVPTVYVDTVASGASWGYGSTWHSLGFANNSFPTSFFDSYSGHAYLGTQNVDQSQWLSVSCATPVQQWVSGTKPNNGFVYYQNEGGTLDPTYFSQWYSADNGSNEPELVVDYDPRPYASATTDSSTYTWGNTAYVNVKVNTFYWADVRWIESGLNLASTDGDTWRGVVGWFKSSSLLPSARWHSAGTLSDGSVLAYYSDSSNPTDYGADRITLTASGCNDGDITGTQTKPGYKRVQFAVTLNQNFGSLVGVTADTRFGMGLSSAVTYGPAGNFSGDLTHPAVSAGWTAQSGARFSVIDTVVKTLTYTAAGSDWFNSASGADDVGTQGRGALTLMWPAVTGASGYHIYLNDGSGAYRQVGSTVGSGATLWSSAGMDFYPGDTEINSLSAPSSANPYYRATTPADATSTTDSTLQAQVTPSPAPSPTASPGSGVLVSDGTYVYEHRWGSYGGPTKWTKIGTGNGNTLGQNYGSVGPDISTIGGNSLSAFSLDGYLYDGATVSPTSAASATLVGVSTVDGTTDSLTLSGAAPLDRGSGATITGNSNNLLLTSGVDSDGTTHLYSVAYTLTSNTNDGSPRYDGYRIREYDDTGAFVADHVLGMTTGTSELIDGVFCDGSFLYLMRWSGADGAHLIKISTTTWQIVNQWGLNQGQTRAISGCYDQINDCFWLGSLDANRLYKYAGAGNAGQLADGASITPTNGFDLRDNPNALYAKTANGGNGAIPTWTAYDVKVVPYTDSGGVSTETTPLTPAAYKVAATLDNRTYSNNDDPQHTTVDLGSWDAHDVSARLDTGALAVDTTDLSIATWGPPAELSRSYLSSRTTSNRFAPGWVFNFDAHLDLTNVGSGAIDYDDASGDAHHFVLAGSTWRSPSGFLGTLAQSGATWTITYPSGVVDTFTTAGAAALWSSETDRNGNTTTYAWNAGNLTITAANGEQINVSCNAAGQITKATYITSAGSREIDYQTASPWQVTYYAGSAVQRSLTYGYDASSRLTAMNQLNWPSAGETATEAFVYGANGVSEVDYPDYNATTKPDARVTISYATDSATLTHYGTVNGTADQPTKVETDSWSPQTGAQTTQVSASATSTESQTTEFAYAANEQLADALTLAASSATATSQDVSACDANGNITAESNGGVGMTTSAYTDPANPNLPTVVTDPNQDVTDNTYDSHGNLTSSEQTLNSAGDVSCTEYSYDPQGRQTEEQQLISGTPSNSPAWATTDYANFAANGQPQTTINRGVELAYGGATQNLTSYATYDPFGNLLTQTDTSGSRVTETNTYDLAGEKLTSTDASGITDNSSYDCLGYVTASWQSATGTSEKDTWQTYTYDPLGRVLTETTLLSDAHGNPTTEDVTVNTWDGVGSELTSSSSTLGGQAAKWTYDDQGNVTAHWADGVYDYSVGRATQDSYDANDQVSSETAPGNTMPTTYVYNADGSTAEQNNPDGSFVAYTYDADGNKIAATVPLHGYSTNNSNVATTTSAYDDANRLIATTEPNGLTTTYAYDELSRQIGAQGGSDAATNTTYNTLGWVLEKTDADGVTDAKTYDPHGCVSTETIGAKTTISTYDVDNRLKTQTDGDGNLLNNIYDAFGNLTEAKHQNAGLTVLKDVSTTVDSLGRPTVQSDSVSGLTHTWTYPVNAATGTQESVSYDTTPLTSVAINHNAREMETSRVATIAAGTTVTRAVADSTSGRDNADRWLQATLQETGYPQLTESRSFDGAGRLQSQSGAGFTTGNSAAYTYDPDTGLKSADSLPLALGGTSSGSYSYDANQRLAADTVNGVAGTLTFDSLGNLKTDTEGATTTTFSYNSANQLTQSVVGSTTTVYGWDATNAWRTSQGPSGNPTQIQMTYNAQGRMATYANSATATTASYAYDAAGQRTKSAVTVAGTTTTTNFAYDGLTLLSLSATQGSSSWRIDYLYDEEGVPYGGIYRSPASSVSPTYFTMITNGRGDVLELLDANGNPFASYRYDAWGLPQASGTTTQATSLINSTLAGQIASRQVLRYASYAYDGESGLYYLSARYYDPATRQFTTADSAKADGEESAYQYCGGDPVGDVDPSGLLSTRRTTTDPSGTFAVELTMDFDIAHAGDIQSLHVDSFGIYIWRLVGVHHPYVHLLGWTWAGIMPGQSLNGRPAQTRPKLRHFTYPNDESPSAYAQYWEQPFGADRVTLIYPWRKGTIFLGGALTWAGVDMETMRQGNASDWSWHSAVAGVESHLPGSRDIADWENGLWAHGTE